MNAQIEGHTVKRYDGELSHLHYLVLEMGGLVLGQIHDALAAFKGRDVALAKKVVTRDSEVDQLEAHTDHEIMNLIARRCPMGTDLRLVFAVNKSASDLERIGDEAVRIAGLVIQIFGNESSDPNQQLLRDVCRIGGLAQTSLQHAMEVFDVWNEAKALQVIGAHREMDEEFQSELRRLMTYILEDSRNIGFAINVVLVIKALERITHHTQSLAEYAMYQIKGLDMQETEPHD